MEDPAAPLQPETDTAEPSEHVSEMGAVAVDPGLNATTNNGLDAAASGPGSKPDLQELPDAKINTGDVSTAVQWSHK